MPRVHTLKARKDIYAYGKRIDDPKTKSGKRLDRSQPRDDNDYILVKEGQTYYKWTFYKSSPTISTSRPKYSQLTRSEYYSTLREINERMSEFTAESHSEVEDFIEDIRNDLDSFIGETQEKFDNVAEHFQGGSTYELLEQRVQDLEEFQGEVDSFDVDEEEELQDLIDSVNRLEIVEN